MKRLLALLVPAIVFAAPGPAVRSAGESNPQLAAKHWTASVKAETEKNYEDALSALAEYRKSGGDAFMASLRLGWLQYLNADYVKAEQAYSAASKMEPKAINPLLGLLNTAQAQKDVKKTKQTAGTLLHEGPSNYKAGMVLAGLHFAEKEYQKSATEYRKVLSRYPDDADAMSGAAWALYYTGEKREALDIFNRLLSISPEYPLAQRGADLAGGKAAK